jgi:hypothetical protein
MFKTIEKLVVAGLCLAVVLVVTAPAAYADDWNKATKITVNQPFEIPGMVLPAGTYVMKIVDMAAERHVVRFLSEDEMTVYATLIAIPNFRLQPTDNTSITFYEPEAGRVRALHAWFYPGYQYGVEFAYPEKEAGGIAAAPEETVAFKEPEPPPFFRERPEATVSEEPLAVFEPAPTAEEIESTEIAPVAPAPEAAAEPSSEAVQLPKTATPIPLVLLIGFLAAGSAAGIRFFHG